MLIAPNSDIYLLKTPFEMDSENVLTFNNYEEQYNYFSSLPKLLLKDATYQRKDGVVRYPGTFDDLIEYNYCMYRNTSYSDKWFYAYIEDMKYENNSMTSIKLKTDAWQTWLFQINYKSMFVVREHVNNDRIGLHTLPENFELGEIVSNKTKTQILNNKSATAIIMAVTDLPRTSATTKGFINGIYSGLYYLLFTNNSTGVNNLNNTILMYAKVGKLEYIQSIFYSHMSVQSVNVEEWTIDNITADVGILTNSNDTYVSSNYDITRPTKLGTNYIPKNNKLFTFPYMYINVSNNAGISIPFHYEDFTNNNPSFKFISSLSIGGNLKLIPVNYKGLAENYEYGINGGKYPVCSWVGDTYINWLTQESVNLGAGITSIALGGLTAYATGGQIGGDALLGGVDQIGNYISERIKREFVPKQIEGNLNSGNINFSYEYAGWSIYYYSIKDEYAKIIDDYMSAYGYKVNSYKIPNITGRRNWNFVKTSGCNIYGDIPQNDLQEIKEMFNKGVTFWHHANTFLDYSQNNDII